ncbi:MAG TPA: DMT family transporter [Bdellovibrionota bacterium]|nr:DMT family transporter [Bdellovibrionota bacterium]
MLPHVCGLLAVVFWGISFVATKRALAEISPITLIFSRFAIGTFLLFGFLLARRKVIAPPREVWPMLAWMGFVGIFVHQLLQAYGLTYTSAVNTGWLIGLIPIWSALFSGLFLRERFGFLKIAGLIIGFFGAAVVVTRGQWNFSLLALPSSRGDFLIMVSTINWTAYTILGHNVIRRLGALQATTLAMFLGWGMLAPFFIYASGWREIPPLSAGGWCAVLFLGIACSGLGYFFWYGALEKVEASKVASYLYIEPLVTVIAARILLKEEIRLITIAGGLLVLAGVFIIQRSPSFRAVESKLSSS